MADTTISSLNTINALSANNYIPISDGTNTTKLGTDSLFGFRNRIINGGMNIWQRGTVINNPTTANFYTADRWGVNRDGNYAADLSVGRVAATGLPGFQYCMALQRNVGSPSTQAIGLWNSNESANTYDLAGGPVTFSFWLKVGANFSTNFITVALYTGTGIDQRIYQYTNQSIILNTGIVPTTTWTRYVFTANMGSTATEIGSYLTWTPTGVAGGDDSVYITGVQLESGTTATPFEFRPIGLELALCQRYYNRITITATDATLTQSFFDAAFWTGPIANDGYCQAVYRYPVTMRTTAIGTDFSDASTFWYHIGGVTQGVLTSIGGNVLGPDRFRFGCRMSYNSGNGLAGQILARNGYTAYLGFSAEL